MINKKILFSLLLLASLSFAHSSLAEESKSSLTNESEAGIVISTGNSPAQSFNLKQTTGYSFDSNVFKFLGSFLRSSSGGKESARYLSLGVRYEREFTDRLGVYAGVTYESDPYAGYLQKYNFDAGPKYKIIVDEDFYWNVEAGYRYTIENQKAGQLNQHFARIYTEAQKSWTKTFSSKLWVEALPALSDNASLQLNFEPSIQAALSEVFSMKTGYLFKFRDTPAPPAKKQWDTVFTTSLVAKF